MTPLTCEEIKIIQKHMNAFKKKLYNQCRWNEGIVYERIVDKLDILYTRRKKYEDAEYRRIMNKLYEDTMKGGR